MNPEPSFLVCPPMKRFLMVLPALVLGCVGSVSEEPATGQEQERLLVNWADESASAICRSLDKGYVLGGVPGYLEMDLACHPERDLGVVCCCPSAFPYPSPSDQTCP